MLPSILRESAIARVTTMGSARRGWPIKLERWDPNTLTRIGGTIAREREYSGSRSI